MISKTGANFYGTWLNGKIHGVCKYFLCTLKIIFIEITGIMTQKHGPSYVSEYKNGRKYGRSTRYSKR